MKKLFFVATLLLGVMAATAQTSGNDCALLTKTETIGDKQLSSAKQEISISNSGRNNISFNALKGSQALILMFSRQKQEVICVSKSSKIYIEFDDKTKFEMNHMRDTDCKGMFVIMLAEVMQNGDKLEMVKSKKIKKITIEYQEVKDGKLVVTPEETVLTAQEAEKILKTIQCLLNKL